MLPAVTPLQHREREVSAADSVASSGSQSLGQYEGANLIVNYLPIGISEEQLRLLFAPYGAIQRSDGHTLNSNEAHKRQQ